MGFKPDMDTEMAKHFLASIMKDSAVSDVQSIEHGELSRAFHFHYGGKEWVVRFNYHSEGYERERFVYDTFAQQGILIPRIVMTGRSNDVSYCISEKAPGRNILSYPESEVNYILSDLVGQFKRINQVNLGKTSGFGWIQPSGNGSMDSWREFLASFFVESQSGFWQDWRQLFETSFLERDVFTKLYSLMMDLAQYSPARRYLVHGDFHFGNMLSDGSRITGIVDWEMALYGDFVFDLATQHIWTPHLCIPERMKAAWRQDGVDIPHFDERLLCAILFKGLDGLRFYSKKNDRAAYEELKTRLLSYTTKAQ